MELKNDSLLNFIESYFSDQFQYISINSYSLASSQENYEKLVEISLKSLKRLDPGNANIEQAAKVADQMQAFAKKKLKELDEK